MRKFIIFVSAVFFLFSCSSGNDGLPSDIQLSSISGTVSEKHEIARDTLVTLNGLDIGSLYGIFPYDEGENGRERSISSPSLIATNGGTFLLEPESSVFTFSGSDVGISGRGNIRLIRYDQKTGEEADLEIDTKREPYLFINEENEKVYEEYYRVSLENLDPSLDRTRIALGLYRSGEGGTFSHDHGIVDPESKSLSGSSRYMGLIDLSDFSEISIFNQLRVGMNDDGTYSNATNRILIQNPITIEEDKEIEAKFPQIYLIEKNDSEMVLELRCTDDITSYQFYGRTIETSYAQGEMRGERKPYMFPLSYDENTGMALIYVGKVADDFIFTMLKNDGETGGERMLLRKIKEDEKGLIRYIDPSKDDGIEIRYEESDCFIPIVFISSDSSSLSDIYVTADFSGDADLRILSSHSDNYGYSADSLYGDKILKLTDSKILEHAYIMNGRNERGAVRIYFSKDGSFEKEESQETIIDASSLPDNLGEASEIQLSWTSDLRLTNLEQSELYGLYVPSNADSGLRDLIRVADHFYVFMADESEHTLSFSNFDFPSFEGEIRIIHMPIYDSSLGINNDDLAQYTIDDRKMFIKAFNYDLSSISNPSRLMLVGEVSGTDILSDRLYFIDPVTCESVHYERNSVIDLSQYDSLVAICRLEVGKDSTEYSLSYALEEAKLLKEGESCAISSNTLFELEPSEGKEMVLSLSDNHYSIPGRARYIEGEREGEYAPYFIDIAGNLIYCGKIDEKVSFLLEGEGETEVTLREISDEERSKLEYINLNEAEYPLEINNDGEETLIVIFTHSPEVIDNFILSSSGGEVRVRYTREKGGFAEKPVNASLSIEAGSTIEHATLREGTSLIVDHSV